MMQGLADLKTRHDRIVLHTSSLPERYIRYFHMAGVRTRWVDFIDNPTNEEIFKKYSYSSKRYWVTYTKLRVWELIEYRKVIIIDCDVYPMKNVDELEHASTPSATMVYQTPHLLNPALMVIAPSLVEFQNILNQTQYIESQDGGELGFFEKYYPFPWSINRLPKEYLWDVLKPFPKGYERIKNFHMFFKKPVLKTADKIWLVKPPALEEALRIRYVRDALYDKQRYSSFLNITNLFWHSYTRFWRNDQMLKAPIVETHSLVGEWHPVKGKKEPHFYIRQHLGRILLLYKKGPTTWIGEGSWMKGYVSIRFQSFEGQSEAFCHGYVSVHDVENQLSLLLGCSGNTLSGTYIKNRDTPPVPLMAEIPFDGVWRNKQGDLFRLWDQNGIVIVVGVTSNIKGEQDSSRFKVEGESTQQTNISPKLKSIYFLREGHSNSMAIHGTYLVGEGFTQLETGGGLLASSVVALQLDDNQELVPLNPHAAQQKLFLKKMDPDEIQTLRPRYQEIIHRLLYEFSDDGLNAWISSLVSLGPKNKDLDEGPEKEASLAPNYSGGYQGCLRCLLEPKAQLTHLYLNQTGRKVVMMDHRPQASVSRFGIGWSSSMGLLLEWFEYSPQSEYWGDLVGDREVVHFRPAWRSSPELLRKYSSTGKDSIVGDEMSCTQEIRKSFLTMSEKNYNNSYGHLTLFPSNRHKMQGVWQESSRPGELHSVLIPPSRDTIYLISKTKQGRVRVGSGPLSIDGLIAYVTWTELVAHGHKPTTHDQRNTGILVMTWVKSVWHAQELGEDQSPLTWEHLGSTRYHRSWIS
eukprot:TRINITY_DN7296_c1_g1_i1.p1 TRINITY_DN7296_c1_g1~~TRINITY_DN7296_c1_g1_i1.p1  ORF type:complete len:803 (-),score=114.98 TRINITY_DN7296_c1_g1_i1:608-3016(-)